MCKILTIILSEISVSENMGMPVDELEGGDEDVGGADGGEEEAVGGASCGGVKWQRHAGKD